MNYNWSIKISIFVLLVMLFPINVKANIICNDGTTSPRCADCHRGCCSHHGGCSNNYSSSSKSSKTTNNSSKSSSSSGSSSSSSSSYTSTTTVKKVEPKSSDTSLKEVIIDSEEIKISNEMSYSTKNESAKINITANDSKATVEYDKNVELNIGDNLINIKVTAENGNAKEYKINIVR